MSNVFSFADTINTDSIPTGFAIAPEGPATYEVTRFAQGRFAGSDKTPPCPQAELTFAVTASDGATYSVRQNIQLVNDYRLRRLLDLFKSARLIPADVTGNIALPWTRLEGARGACEVAHRKWRGSDGQERTNVDLTFLPAPKNNIPEQDSGQIYQAVYTDPYTHETF